MQYKEGNAVTVLIFFILALCWFMCDLMKAKGLSYTQKYKILL
jgi:hypothetical protein